MTDTNETQVDYGECMLGLDCGNLARIQAEKRNNALAVELTDVEAEAALISEGICVWGPDAERFERMFKVVMRSRLVALEGDE